MSSDLKRRLHGHLSRHPVLALFYALLFSMALTMCSGRAEAVESTGTLTSKTFTNTTQEFPNPERGYYRSAAYVAPYFYLQDVTAANIADVYSKGSRLSIQVVYLGDYKNTFTLPQSFLDNITAKIALFRAGGVKLILLPAYNYDSNGSDASLSIGLNHIAQLSAIYKANADVIPYLHEGMIGSYGENWGSTTMCPDSAGISASCRVQVLNATFAATDPRTQVQTRYVKHMANIYPTGITAAIRYSGSNQSRGGQHNDCFMSSPNDVGTYQSNTLGLSNPERARVANDTQWTAYGGETCDGFSGARMACSDILSEGPTYHLTFLNRNYSQNFFDSWTNGGCIDQVTRSIGYRFQIDAFSHQSTATATQSVTFNLDMENQGWSRIHSARVPVIQLVNSSNVIAQRCTGSQNLRNLAPSASSATKLTIRCTIPAGFPTGAYTIYLAIPDVFATTASDPRFSVRPANLDNSGNAQAWDAANGRFKMGTTLTIQ
jgi:hypothetical protein